MRHIWVVGRNETDQPLYFSDAPVTRYGHVPLPFGVAGLATVGVQIDFPVSSNNGTALPSQERDVPSSNITSSS